MNTYNGIQAFEDGWDIVTQNLFTFFIANLVICLIFLISTTIISITLSHFTEGGAAVPYILSLFINYVILSPVWQASNISASSKHKVGIELAGFKINLMVGIKSILAYWVSRVLIVLALFFFILPGIYLLCRFSLILPAIVQEDTGILSSLKRSWQLTQGRFVDFYALNAAMGFLSPLAALPAGIPLLAMIPMDSAALFKMYDHIINEN